MPRAGNRAALHRYGESQVSHSWKAFTRRLSYIGGYARVATKEFILVIVGVVVAVSIFINPKLDFDQSPRPLNIYSLHCARMAELFRSFYENFEKVMSAQVIFQALTPLSHRPLFMLSSLPYAAVVIVLTFLCGLLPVIGNIISNTIIVGIAFTISPQFAGWALLYLVVDSQVGVLP